MKNAGVNNFSRWNFYSLILIFCFLVILLFKWPLTPTFIDIYYHLSVVLGFNEAGGFVTTDFWEFAPVGRPHLYPPLLHFLMFLFYKIGLPLISVARLYEFTIFPILLIVIWWLMKEFFSQRLAFFAVLTGLCVYPFYLSIINFIPASLAAIFGLLSYIFLEKRKAFVSIIFLGLSFYTHAGVSWVFLISFIIYGIFNNEGRKICFLVVLFSLLLAAPILIYQFSLRDYVRFSRATERFVLEVNLWLYLAAITAIIISYKKKGKYLFFLSLLIASFLPLFFGYRYRYLSGQGSLALILLSSISLEGFYLKSCEVLCGIFKNLNKRLSESAVFLGVLVFFLIFSPTLIFQKGKIKFYMLNSTYVNLVPGFKRVERPNEFSLYFQKHFNEIKDIIENNSQADEIIYCNKEYIGGLISVFANRAASTGMLVEVKPYKRLDPICSAKLIIWVKDPDETQDKNLTFVIDRYNLIKIAETDIAYIYKNPNSKAKKIISKAAVPTGLVYAILFSLAAFFVWDLSS